MDAKREDLCFSGFFRTNVKFGVPTKCYFDVRLDISKIIIPVTAANHEVTSLPYANLIESNEIILKVKYEDIQHNYRRRFE